MIKAKDRMKEFNKLPPNIIAWETFKRLVGQFGLEKAVDKAKEVCKTFPEGAITEGDKKLIKIILKS